MFKSQLTVLFVRVWNQNDLDVLAKSRKARLLNKWKERHGIPEAGTMGPLRFDFQVYKTYTHSKWTYAAKITQDLGNFV